MKKKLVLLVLGMFVVAITAGTALAADCTGTVTAVKGTSVTVKCKDGKEVVATGKAKVGAKVKVKADKIVSAQKHKKHKKHKKNKAKVENKANVVENKKETTENKARMEKSEKMEKTESN